MSPNMIGAHHRLCRRIHGLFVHSSRSDRASRAQGVGPDPQRPQASCARWHGIDLVLFIVVGYFVGPIDRFRPGELI